MQKCVGSLQYTHYVAPSSPQGLTAPQSPASSQPPSPSPPPPSTSPTIPLVKVSSTPQSDILAIAEETWEEEREFENEGYLQVLREKKSKYCGLNGQQQASQSIPEIRKESLGSCGSLADSEGSLSPGRQTCCIVVVDHDKCLLSPRPLNLSYEASSPRTLKFNYGAGTSQKYNYEDDVFFT